LPLSLTADGYACPHAAGNACNTDILSRTGVVHLSLSDRHVLEANFQHELATIREEAKGGFVWSTAARRGFMPKANCTLRPLGILSLPDRIVQRALLLAMEAICESDFNPAS
jgi:retron-type reverse transcriptase